MQKTWKGARKGEVFLNKYSVSHWTLKWTESDLIFPPFSTLCQDIFYRCRISMNHYLQNQSPHWELASPSSFLRHAPKIHLHGTTALTTGSSYHQPNNFPKSSTSSLKIVASLLTEGTCKKTNSISSPPITCFIKLTLRVGCKC